MLRSSAYGKEPKSGGDEAGEEGQVWKAVQKEGHAAREALREAAHRVNER